MSGRPPRWDGPVGLVESYDPQILAFLVERPALLEQLHREHADTPHRACRACPGAGSRPAPRCLVRLTIDAARRVRAARAAVPHQRGVITDE